MEKIKELLKNPYLLLGLSVFGVGVFLAFRKTPEKKEEKRERPIIINNISRPEKKLKKREEILEEKEEILEEVKEEVKEVKDGN